jgi:hypothetical protein
MSEKEVGSMRIRKSNLMRAVAYALTGILALFPGGASAAVMTFTNLAAGLDPVRYSEDGITVYHGGLATASSLLDGGITMYEEYGPYSLTFTMDKPFSAIDLELGGGFGYYENCYIYGYYQKSDCKPATYGGGVPVGVRGIRVDGSVVDGGFSWFNRKLEFGPEWSKLTSLHIELAGVSGYRFFDFFGGIWGQIPPYPGEDFLTVPAGYYSFFDCLQTCVSASVDNVNLVPSVDVAPPIVVAPVPLPASLTLGASGVMMFVLIGMRRRRRARSV